MLRCYTATGGTLAVAGGLMSIIDRRFAELRRALNYT